jgi:hypothetical protein
MSLAVGLGSKEFVSKSLSSDAKKSSDPRVAEPLEEDPLRHL